MGVSRRAGRALIICSHGLVPKRTNCALWRRRTLEEASRTLLLEDRETHLVTAVPYVLALKYQYRYLYFCCTYYTRVDYTLVGVMGFHLVYYAVLLLLARCALAAVLACVERAANGSVARQQYVQAVV